MWEKKRKDPKTLRGMGRKMLTGDGRKNLDTVVRKEWLGEKKEKRRE